MKILFLFYFSDILKFLLTHNLQFIHTANCLAPGTRDIHVGGDYEKSRFSSGIAITCMSHRCLRAYIMAIC